MGARATSSRPPGVIAGAISLALGAWAYVVGCGSLFAVDGVRYTDDAEVGDGEDGDRAAGDASTGEVGACQGVCQISAGGQSACALRDDGRILCWGNNFYGTLGHSPDEDFVCIVDGGPDGEAWPCAWRPQPVTGVANAVQVSVGATHACAVLGDGGAACWGDNGLGELGHDPSLTRDPECPSAALRDAGVASERCQPVASPVLGLPPATQVAAGRLFSCAVTTASEIYCWGDNRSLQLGNASAGLFSPTPVRVDGIAGATEVRVSLVDARSRVHACARLGDGGVVCWGSDVEGEIGYDARDAAPDADPGCMDGPCARRARPVLGLPPATHVQVGLEYTCATTDDPSASSPLYCWGDADYDTFARGTGTQTSPVPGAAIALPANGIRRAVLFETRWSHAALVDESGVMWTWGDNRYSALGVPREEVDCIVPYPCETNPSKVTSFPGRAVLIATGLELTFAKTEDGSVFGWGLNPDGRVGHPNAVFGDTDHGDVPCGWPDSNLIPYPCNGTPTKIEGL